MPEPISGIVFDAYGTLLDVYAVEARLEALFPGRGRALAVRWRDKQIEYSRLRTMSGCYARFLDDHRRRARLRLRVRAGRALGRRARRVDGDLRAAAAAPGSSRRAGGSARARADARCALQRRRDDAWEGACGGRDRAAVHACAERRARAQVQDGAEAYQLGPDAFGAPAGRLVFVSSNGWDAAGAAWFGYRAFWINRAGAPRERPRRGRRAAPRTQPGPRMTRPAGPSSARRAAEIGPGPIADVIPADQTQRAGP